MRTGAFLKRRAGWADLLERQCRTLSKLIDFSLDVIQLTPPMSNDDENKRPVTAKAKVNSKEISSEKEKKSSSIKTTLMTSMTTTRQVQYKILPRGQPDEATAVSKKVQISQNDSTVLETSATGKSQRNRRRTDRRATTDPNRKQANPSQPFSNLTNNNSSHGQNSHTFRYSGPRCWKQFRLNRCEVSRCLWDWSKRCFFSLSLQSSWSNLLYVLACSFVRASLLYLSIMYIGQSAVGTSSSSCSHLFVYLSLSLEWRCSDAQYTLNHRYINVFVDVRLNDQFCRRRCCSLSWHSPSLSWSSGRRFLLFLNTQEHNPCLIFDVPNLMVLLEFFLCVCLHLVFCANRRRKNCRHRKMMIFLLLLLQQFSLSLFLSSTNSQFLFFVLFVY